MLHFCNYFGDFFVQEKYQPMVKSDSSLSGLDAITPGKMVFIF